MLPDSSLLKFKNWSALHYIVAGLLVVHTSWIIVHLNLVSRELINPWKLGGYGMYTQPNNRAKLRLFDIRSKPKRISKRKYIGKGFRDANFRYVFRCRKIGRAEFLIFLTDNPHLANRDLRFVIREREFSRSPVGTKWVKHSVVELRWPQSDKFTYSGEVCGKKYAGEVVYQP